MLATILVLQANLPLLAISMTGPNQMKADKQHRAHPLRRFLDECRSEWQMYIEMIGCDHIPPPPYPYTEELMHALIAHMTMELSQATKTAAPSAPVAPGGADMAPGDKGGGLVAVPAPTAR